MIQIPPSASGQMLSLNGLIEWLNGCFIPSLGCVSKLFSMMILEVEVSDGVERIVGHKMMGGGCVECNISVVAANSSLIIWNNDLLIFNISTVQAGRGHIGLWYIGGLQVSQIFSDISIRGTNQSLRKFLTFFFHV